MPAPVIGCHFSEWVRLSYTRVTGGLCMKRRAQWGLLSPLQILKRPAGYTGKLPLAVPWNIWALVFCLWHLPGLLCQPYFRGVGMRIWTSGPNLLTHTCYGSSRFTMSCPELGYQIFKGDRSRYSTGPALAENWQRRYLPWCAVIKLLGLLISTNSQKEWQSLPHHIPARQAIHCPEA